MLLLNERDAAITKLQQQLQASNRRAANLQAKVDAAGKRRKPNCLIIQLCLFLTQVNLSLLLYFCLLRSIQ